MLGGFLCRSDAAQVRLWTRPCDAIEILPLGGALLFCPSNRWPTKQGGGLHSPCPACPAC